MLTADFEYHIQAKHRLIQDGYVQDGPFWIKDAMWVAVIAVRMDEETCPYPPNNVYYQVCYLGEKAVLFPSINY